MLKKPIGISVLGLCAVLFVLSVCVNIFSKKKLSATLVSDGTGLKNKDMSLKFIFTGTCGEYSSKLRLRNMLTGQCEDIKVHWKLSFRLGDIYVREYGEPVTDSLCIYVETGGNVPATDYDRIAAKALSLSMYLSDGGIGHYMAFYSFSQQRKVFEHIDSADSFTVALDSLLSSQPEQGKERLTEFSELFERSGFVLVGVCILTALAGVSKKTLPIPFFAALLSAVIFHKKFLTSLAGLLNCVLTAHGKSAGVVEMLVEKSSDPWFALCVGAVIVAEHFQPS